LSTAHARPAFAQTHGDGADSWTGIRDRVIASTIGLCRLSRMKRWRFQSPPRAQPPRRRAGHELRCRARGWSAVPGWLPAPPFGQRGQPCGHFQRKKTSPGTGHRAGFGWDSIAPIGCGRWQDSVA